MGARMQVELCAADLNGVIGAVTSAGIPLYEVVSDGELTICATVERADYARLQKIARRKGWTLRIVRRKGFFWRIEKLTRRPVLVALLTIMLLVSLYLPEKILKVEVEGNLSIPDNRILEAAQSSGIGFWADRREVRSEKVKNTLLEALPELQWAGVNTYGSRAVISVRERDVQSEENTDFGVSSLVASRDGVIIETTVSRGSCLVAPGQVVRAGQTLISGMEELPAALRMTQAEGEVFALTRWNLTVKTLEHSSLRTEKKETAEKFSLLLGKKRINFYQGSGISDSSCVKMYSKYVLTLPGGFSLPVAILKETVFQSELTQAPRDEAVVAEELSFFARQYLHQQMIAGSILQAEEATGRSNSWILNGSYECQEMIGRVKPEEIGVYNGKTD